MLRWSPARATCSAGSAVVIRDGAVSIRQLRLAEGTTRLVRRPTCAANEPREGVIWRRDAPARSSRSRPATAEAKPVVVGGHDGARARDKAPAMASRSRSWSGGYDRRTHPASRVVASSTCKVGRDPSRCLVAHHGALREEVIEQARGAEASFVALVASASEQLPCEKTCVRRAFPRRTHAHRAPMDRTGHCSIGDSPPPRWQSWQIVDRGKIGTMQIVTPAVRARSGSG